MLSKLFSLFKLAPALLTGGRGLLIAGAVIVAVLGVQELRVQSWKMNAYEAQQAASDARLSNQLLTAAIARQNEQITRLEDTAQKYADQASLAALRAEREGLASLATIRTAPAGHKEMNRWLRADFLQ